MDFFVRGAGVIGLSCPLIREPLCLFLVLVPYAREPVLSHVQARTGPSLPIKASVRSLMEEKTGFKSLSLPLSATVLSREHETVRNGACSSPFVVKRARESDTRPLKERDVLDGEWRSQMRSIQHCLGMQGVCLLAPFEGRLISILRSWIVGATN